VAMGLGGPSDMDQCLADLDMADSNWVGDWIGNWVGRAGMARTGLGLGLALGLD
jgi:hypothetical protein